MMSIAEVSLRPLHVLVADDNQMNCKIVSAMLERRGHTVSTVPNGREALAALMQTSYDVVVMDVAMPVMDGVQATEAIRSSVTDRVDSSIPIIALTAHYMDADRDRYIQAGMDAFLSKPVRVHALLKTMHDVLVEKGRDSEAGPGMVAARPKAACMRNLDLVQSEFGLEREDVFTLYGIMDASLMREFAALKVAVQEGWTEEVVEMAHSLAGSALDIVVDGPALLAREIEHAARSGATSELKALCAEMEPQVESVCRQIRDLLDAERSRT